MTLHTDASGLAYTANSNQLVTDFDGAITSYLAARTDTMALVDGLLAADPDMPMAVCLRGYLLKLAAHPKFNVALNDCITRAQELVARAGSSVREQAHAEVLRLWSTDNADAALNVLESILQDHPMDMLALRIAHYLHFYNGRGEPMRDSVARVFGAWREDHPHYGYLLGMQAFGLEESGEYEAALEYGQAAIERDPADVWATHAVAHVYQMQERFSEGIEWLDGLRKHWQVTNNFRYHVHWHEALYWLGIGTPQRALSIYDETLAASLADDFYLDLCNNASLLWRLEFVGIDVGDRWRALSDLAARHVDDRELVFISLHYLIPLAVTGAPQTQALLSTLRGWASMSTDQGRVCADVGLALADAIVKSPAAPEPALELLAKHQASTFRIGGSVAQRDLFRLLAIDDAQRANRPDLIVSDLTV